MFLGHIGLGFTAKKFTPRISLRVLIPVALSLDLLSLPGILLAKEPNSLVPWTHGLLMAAVWAVLAFCLALLIGRSLRLGLVLGLLVVSHWLLDLIAWPMIKGTGLPLFFDMRRTIGWGLYGTAAGSIAGEVLGLILIAAMIVMLSRGRKTGVGKR